MLTAQHAIYLETRSQQAHDAGDTEEAIRYAKMRDIVFLDLRRNPSEVDAYSAWAHGLMLVETPPPGSARCSSGVAQ